MTSYHNFIASGPDAYFDLSEDHATDHFNIGPARAASIQIIVDNTDADGYMKPQVSNDRSNWVDVAFVDENGVTQTDGYHLLSGQNANHMFDLTSVSAGWLRLFYDRTSGTGGCDVKVHVKKF